MSISLVKVGAVFALLAVIGAMLVQAAFAQGNAGGTRPGWGHGDKNHVHTGPPGLTVRPAR